METCMDSSDWLKSIVHEENELLESSSPSTKLIECTRTPVADRRLRPLHDQALKCPRCDSMHTKFCYYNNYSLSQPRYFCKTCRRYWTKGGSLRNVPVGGGCRKNNRQSNNKIKSLHNDHRPQPMPLNLQPPQPVSYDFRNATELNLSLMDCKYNNMGNFDFMKTTPMFRGLRSQLFMGGSIESELGLGLEVSNHGFTSASFLGVDPLGFNIDCGNRGALVEYNANEEVKPMERGLSLEWQHDQGCGEVGRDSFGYSGGLGFGAGVINGHNGHLNY